MNAQKIDLFDLLRNKFVYSLLTAHVRRESACQFSMYEYNDDYVFGEAAQNEMFG